MIVDETKSILKQFNVFAKKNYGQNFLVNKRVIENIISGAQITKNDCVVEIGPGIGSLTEALCLNAKKVLCFEIDQDMVNILGETLKQYDNKKIILGDVLKQNIKQEIEDYFGAGVKVKVVANLPYYVTTPIMFKLLEVDNIISETFMVQKETGDRFTGEVNSKDYNALSVFVKYFTDTKKILNVGRNNFFPIPNVDSVVINCRINKKEVGVINEENFLKFIKISFEQRRKTFVNNISIGYKKEKREIEEALKTLNYDERIRSESLELKDFSKIYKYIFERNIYKAFAKINLALQVLDKRTDGYHNLRMLVSKIDLYDIIEFEECNEIRVATDKFVCEEKDNIVYKAAKYLKEFYNVEKGIKIKIQKNIPDGGGLGGGSSDCATTIKALNDLWGLNLSNEALKEMGLMFGSDVPLFFEDNLMLVEGRGEKVTPFRKGLNECVLIVNPRFKSSTKEVYENYNESSSNSIDMVLDNIDSDYYCYLFNDLEETAQRTYPDYRLNDIKQEMRSSNSKSCLMSGSGACVFGLYSEQDIDKAFSYIRSKFENYEIIKCKTISNCK